MSFKKNISLISIKQNAIVLDYNQYKGERQLIVFRLEDRSCDWRLCFSLIKKLRRKLDQQSDELKKFKKSDEVKKIKDKSIMKGFTEQELKIYNNQKIQKQFGWIMGVNYWRSGRTQIKSQKGLRISESGMNIITTLNSGINQKWSWYQLINGRYVFIANSGRVLGGHQNKTIYYAGKIGTCQTWGRIAVGKKSVWKSLHNTFLSVNQKGQLNLINDSPHLNANFSLWTDVGNFLN